MTMKIKQQHKKGFSLVEMAIVISVMAVILISLFSIITDLNIKSTINDNEKRMDEVSNAINAFYLNNGYIPCPAARNASTSSAAFGVSTDCTVASIVGETVDVGAAANTVRIGVVPVRTLGLSDTQALDRYGNKISYAIVQNLGVSKTIFDASTATSSAISINDSSGNSITNNLVSTDFISYILTSHGINGRGAYNNVGNQAVACGSSTDSENCDDDNLYIETLIDPINYDDSIRWQTRQQLQFNSKYEFNNYTSTSPASRRLFDKYAMITYEFGNAPAGAAATTQTYGSANSWVTRAWNVVRNNSLTNLSLDGSSIPQSVSPIYYAGNPTQITLGAGTYWIKATAVGVQNGYNKLRLHNASTSSVIEYGAIDSSSPCNLNGTVSSVFNAFPFLVTVVSFNATTTITLDQIFSSTTCATNRLGQNVAIGGGTHSVIEIWEF